MLSRTESIFTIGYDGPVAVVDGQAKKRYSGLSTRELAEKGLFRAAASSAIWSKDPKELEMVAEIYGKSTGSSDSSGSSGLSDSAGSLQRLFGVYPVEVTRSMVL